MKSADVWKDAFIVDDRGDRHMRSNAFFLNIGYLSSDIRAVNRLGELSYYGLYRDPYGSSVERITCQIAYEI